MIRPTVVIALRRWHEVILSGGIAALGLWLMALGGYIFLPIGVAVLAFAIAFGIMAHRRLRFSMDAGSAGMVEVDEAQIGYFGPTDGGFISLSDLIELRLLRINNRRVWRLKQADGQTLLIPVDVTGAERLFDAFTSLPDMDTSALVASLDIKTSLYLKPIWRRGNQPIGTTNPTDRP